MRDVNIHSSARLDNTTELERWEGWGGVVQLRGNSSYIKHDFERNSSYIKLLERQVFVEFFKSISWHFKHHKLSAILFYYIQERADISRQADISKTLRLAPKQTGWIKKYHRPERHKIFSISGNCPCLRPCLVKGPSGHAFMRQLISIERTTNWPHNLLMAPECRMKHLSAEHHRAADFT